MNPLSLYGGHMELLAPAGTMENFIAALESGADAIYLGGKQFNARSHADNFDRDDLTEAVRLAHLCGVQVHVTVNILIGDKEMKALAVYLQELEAAKVDAILVQDLAVARLARKVAPKLHLHCSTQLTATNIETVRFYEDLGFSRVVLSRELNLEEIRTICKEAKAEIEIFVHGALCVCYSGQCLMSSFIGGRSGNRGSCAQPCRLPYELINEKSETLTSTQESFLLSPKDLNYSEYIGELIKMGVASFKIEGRMKKVTYVRQIVSAYRRIMDAAGKCTQKDRTAVQSGFNRGFSTAYLEDRSGRDMITAVAPNNQGKLIGHSQVKKGKVELSLTENVELGSLLKVISKTGEVFYYTFDTSWVHKTGLHFIGSPEEGLGEGKVYLTSTPKVRKSRGLSEFTRKYPLYGYLQITDDKKTSLTCILEDGLSVEVFNDFEPQLANHKPTGIEKVQEQLGRLGNTVFNLQSISIPDNAYMWPASVLNDLRRQAVAKLEEGLLKRHYQEWLRHGREIKDYKKWGSKLDIHDVPGFHEPLVSVRTDEMENVKAAIAGGAKKIVFGGDRLYRLPYDRSIYQEVVDYCHSHNVFICMATPRVVKQKERALIRDTIHCIVDAQPDSIAFHSPGILVFLREAGYEGHIEADTGLNLFNGQASNFYEELGISSIAPSQEMTLQQLSLLSKEVKVPIETMVHGKIEMMVSEYCVIGSFIGSGLKSTCPRPCLHGTYYLKDRKGEVFPLRTDPYCRMHIMNSHDLDMRAYVPELVKKGISILRIEGRQENPALLETIVKDYVNILSGKRPAPSKQIDGDMKITRGHYFRGVFEGK